MPEAAGLHYELYGPADAPAVILSSGLGGAGKYWLPNLEALSQEYRVVLYDHRGTGLSDRALQRAESVEAMAADVEALMDALGLARAHFIGHALGAMIGMSLAQATRRVDKLIAINGWRTLSPHTRRCFAARIDLLDGAGVEPFLRAQPLFLFPPDWIAAHDAALDAEFAHHVAAFPGAGTMKARIAAVQAFAPDEAMLSALPDTLVIATRDDFLVPYAAAMDLAAAIPDADVAVFDWGGHACNVTDPEDFNRIVLDFLRS